MVAVYGTVYETVKIFINTFTFHNTYDILFSSKFILDNLIFLFLFYLSSIHLLYQMKRRTAYDRHKNTA